MELFPEGLRIHQIHLVLIQSLCKSARTIGARLSLASRESTRGLPVLSSSVCRSPGLAVSSCEMDPAGAAENAPRAVAPF